MSQISVGDAEYAGKRKKTRREVFLEEMGQVVPRKSLVDLTEPLRPVAGRGRHPYPLETMLRVHLTQNRFAVGDPAMEEAPGEITPMRAFAGLSLTKAIPDETTILDFRHLPEEDELAPEILKRVNGYLTREGLMPKRGSIADATIIAAPSSTKNAEGERDPEMSRMKKGNPWHFGMKAHVGLDADSGLMHTVMTTPANESDLEVVDGLRHGKEAAVHADAGCTGADKRVARKGPEWRIAAKRGRIKAVPEGREKRKLEAIERRKASERANVEHPFRVVKRQFGLMKERSRGLVENTAQRITLSALRNMGMAPWRRLVMTGWLRPKYRKAGNPDRKRGASRGARTCLSACNRGRTRPARGMASVSTARLDLSRQRSRVATRAMS